MGEISHGKVNFNDVVKVVADVWNKLPERFPSVELDEFVIMPSHIHGIIVGAPLAAPGINVAPGIKAAVGINVLPGPIVADTINKDTAKQKNTAKQKIATRQKGAASSAPTLGNVIRAFKSISAIAVNRMMDRQGIPLWQRNYYDRIIRDEKELHTIREYIRHNPLKGDEDEENPIMKRMGNP